MISSAPPLPAVASRPWRFDFLVGALLVCLTCGLYFPVLSFEFTDWDDPLYVTDNPAVQSGLNPASLRYAWTTLDYGNWIPLTWMSYELDIALFGENPHALHAVNLFWHVANVLLAYVVLFRMTAARGRSAVVAVLFAVHPLHVESVAWIAERKDVLSTFFLLTTLLAYDWYARRPSAKRMAVVALSFACGLMSKSMVVTLPVLLLLIDHWPLRRIAWSGTSVTPESAYPARTPWKLLLEKAPLFLLSLATGAITIYAQKETTAVGTLRTFPFSIRLGNSVNAYAWYLEKTFVPTDLCTFYAHPLSRISWGGVALSAAVLLAVNVIVWLWRRRPHVVAGWLWFVISLLPVIGLLQVGGQAWADRYAYIPHLGLFVLVVWQTHELVAPRFGHVPSVVLAAAAVLGCVALTVPQIATWRTSETMWAQALKVDPDNPMAHYQLGWALRQKDELDEAQYHFEKVLVKRPNDVRSLVSLGALHHNQGRVQKAIEYYEFALRIDPNDKLAKKNLGVLKSALAEKGAAPPEATKRPQEATDRNERGLAQARAGRMEDALRSFREAVEIDPAYADAHNNAAMLQIRMGRKKDARKSFEKAVEASPDNVDFRFNLAQLLEELGALPEARDQYDAVLRLKPDDVEAKLYRDQIDEKLRKYKRRRL